ncbi:MAG: hypothetical protein GY841_01665 [FCB group bacterium]|nr:hypothetical protein [FCB group bacterium]
MRISAVHLICAVPAIIAFFTVPAAASAAVSLTPADFVGPNGTDTIVILAENWLYHAGDDSLWADPALDDSQWKHCVLESFEDGFPIDDWPGRGWFRLHFEVDSALWHEPLAILVNQVGATEIYLDGQLLLSQGKVGGSAAEEVIYIRLFGAPHIFQFSSGQHHLLAVRYSNHQSAEYAMRGDDPSFAVTIGRAQGFFESMFSLFGRAIHQQMFITVMALSFSLLHLLLFIFYPSSKENLFFAILTAGFAGMAFAPTQLAVITSPERARLMLGLMKISLLVVSVFGLRLFFALFYNRVHRLFYSLPGVGIIMLALFWYIPLNYYYYLVILSLVGGLAVICTALIRRKRGVIIISIGYTAFAVFSTIQMLMELGVISQKSWIHQPYMFGILVMLVSLSIYLARDFARQSLELKVKLNEVRDLSEKTLNQERQAKEQEMRQKLLETDLAHQAEQLKEAEKLEKALKDLKQVNYELQTTQAKLFQSGKMASLGQLVAGIAHEINTPIGAAGSMHDTLKRAVKKIHLAIEDGCDHDDCCTKKSVEEFLGVVDDANEVISSAVERVTGIVRRLRSFARLDEAELKTVDIHEGLDDSLVLLHHEMKHGIRVVKNYGKVPSLSCYPGRLNQVFLNLLVNAVHAMQGEGEITITTKTDGEKVTIIFVDQGEGIPENRLERIFDPGYTTKGVGVGTGLGLSICYQIIEDHHGQIKVKSRLGEGTTFTLILPTNLDKILETG